MENIRSPKISACMIVKNEEELLPNCLNSIKDAVDEIIVVDTGSTDNTVNIAKLFGAKVYHHPWNDSFSEARNYCLNHASGDWVLQIDADEELEQADIPKLRLAISDPRYNGIIIAIQSIIKDGMHTFYHPRVFRRGKGFYRDIIHEQTIIEGERLPTEIRLYHHGYNLDEKKMRVKWQRTTYLLKKQIEHNKLDSFAWFNLIRNYRIQDLFQDGINAGNEALKILKPESFLKCEGTNVSLHHYVMILYETANCCLYNDNLLKAKEMCHLALSQLAESNVEEENIDIIFTLACVYLKEGDYRKAITYFVKFLSLREWHLHNINNISLMVDTIGYDYSAYNGLGYCFGQLGQSQTAINYLQKAISSNARYLTSYKNLVLCYLRMENLTEAVNTLLKTISEGIADSDVFLHLGELYIKQESYEKAIPHLEAYVRIYPGNKDALLNIARCYERLGHWGAALVGYKSALGE